MIKIKQIAGFPEYFISNQGEVISTKFEKKKVLSPSTTTGYKKVTLKKGTKSYTFQIHRLVAQAFIKNPKGLAIVNHKNGNKLDCKLSNLEWTSRKGNAEHYEREIKPKNKKMKIEKVQNDMITRLKIISHASTACTGNPELFQSIVTAALQNCKGI
jgi:hypothetical protein